MTSKRGAGSATYPALHRRGTRPIGTSTAIADALADNNAPMAIDVLAVTIGENPSKVRARVEALDNLGIVRFNKADRMVTLNSKWG